MALAAVSTACAVRDSHPPQGAGYGDPRFDPEFWVQIAFNGKEGQPVSLQSWPLESPPLNLFILTVDETGSALANRLSRSRVQTIRRMYPRLVRALTGRPFTGAITAHDQDQVMKRGWLYVMFVSAFSTAGVCAHSEIGADPGLITLSLACDWSDKRRFAHVVAHEVGHAYGLYHVAEPGHVMHPTDWSATSFSAKETYHANLLYRVGRGRAWCGWPFGSACRQGRWAGTTTGRTALSRSLWRARGSWWCDGTYETLIPARHLPGLRTSRQQRQEVVSVTDPVVGDGCESVLVPVAIQTGSGPLSSWSCPAGRRAGSVSCPTVRRMTQGG